MKPSPSPSVPVPLSQQASQLVDVRRAIGDAPALQRDRVVEVRDRQVGGLVGIRRHRGPDLTRSQASIDACNAATS